MAVGDAYASAAEYRGRINKSDTAVDAAILEDLTAVSRYIEWILGGRFFTQDAAAVARVYDPPRLSDSVLYVDDVASKSGLVLKCDQDRDGLFSDETAWTIDSDFVVIPLNADKGPEPQPWTGIQLPSWSSKSWAGRIELTAKYGWPAVPVAIKDACIQVTAILRLESPRATERVPEAIDKAVGESSLGRRLLGELVNAYRRHGTGVFA